MAWYRTGTVGVTNGSTTVALSGGNALANIFPGDSFLGPDGRAYEVALVTSATSFTLATAYQGATATGQPYAIQPTGSTGALRLLNDQVSDLVTNYQAGRDAWASAPASTLKGRKSGGAGAVENLTPADVLTLLTGGTPGALMGTERLPVLQGTSAVGLTVNQLLSRAAGQALPFEIGGQRVVTMTSAGLGIGTATPAAPLHVRGVMRQANTSDGNDGIHSYNAAGQRVGALYGAGSSYFRVQADLGQLSLRAAAGPLSFEPHGIQKGIFSGSGLYIGTTNPTPGAGNTNTGLHFETASDGMAMHISRGPNPPIFANLNGTGTIMSIRQNGGPVGSISVTATSTAYNTTSDYRVKINLEPLTGALDRIDSIPVYRGNFTADPDAPKVDMFLAHEAQAGVPEAVTGEKDAVEEIGDAVGYREHDPETGVPILASKETLTGITQAEAPEGYVWTKTGERPVYQGIDQSKLVPLHHAGIQELRAEIRSLKARLDALEAAA